MCFSKPATPKPGAQPATPPSAGADQLVLGGGLNNDDELLRNQGLLGRLALLVGRGRTPGGPPANPSSGGDSLGGVGSGTGGGIGGVGSGTGGSTGGSSGGSTGGSSGGGLGSGGGGIPIGGSRA